MNNKNVIYVDGTFRANNKKDISSRRMVVCILDQKMPSQFQIRGVIKQGGSIDFANLIAVMEGINYAFKNNYKDLMIKISNQVVAHWIKCNEIKGKINNKESAERILERITGVKSWFNSFEVQIIPSNLNKAKVVLDIKTKGKDFV